MKPFEPRNSTAPIHIVVWPPRERFVVLGFNVVRRWRERIRQRRALGRLDDRMLRDIGLTRFDAIAEASKPFWR